MPSQGFKAVPSKVAIGWGGRRDPYPAPTSARVFPPLPLPPKLLWCFPDVADCLRPFHSSRTCVGCASVARLLLAPRPDRAFFASCLGSRRSIEKIEAESRGNIYVTTRLLRPFLPFEPSLRLQFLNEPRFQLSEYFRLSDQVLREFGVYFDDRPGLISSHLLQFRPEKACRLVG